MGDKALREKVKEQLRLSHIKLWDPPYTYVLSLCMPRDALSHTPRLENGSGNVPNELIDSLSLMFVAGLHIACGVCV